MSQCVRIVAVSDLHGVLPEIPECDLLLIAGDIEPTSNHDVRFQAEWLDGPFRHWLAGTPAGQRIFIAGNHDLVFEQNPALLPRDLPAVYLQDSGTEWRGLHIWGTPWQPWFFDWAFNLREPDLVAKWDMIPAGTDILIVHGPPHRYGDAVPRKRGLDNTGSPSLLARIEQIKPKLVVFGHIHEGRGQWQLGPTVLANVTILDEKYQHVYPPWEYELAVDD
ncbi:MAG: metallophosphoesterase [Gemmataceae bacterium]